jgi:uroporphyrinogen decarboxylase
MMMTNKQRFETVLSGGIPDAPPHFEIDFHLGKEMFGLDGSLLEARDFSSERDKQEAHAEFHLELQTRLVEDLGYACSYFHAGLPPELGITKIKDALGSKALLRTHEWSGVFSMPSGSEIMDFVIMMYEQPEEMHAQARARCDTAKETLRIHADAGADVFFLCYDFGFNQGPFISPSQFAEFVTPYLAELVQASHDLGIKAFLHSDGNINVILDQIHSTGIDGYQSIDPQGFMDIKEVREKYPDWILMGNVHCGMMQDIVDADIRKSVGYCMEHGGLGKPYIFSTSNCIFPGMPIESYRIMLDEYQRLCGPADTGVRYFRR